MRALAALAVVVGIGCTQEVGDDGDRLEGTWFARSRDVVDVPAAEDEAALWALARKDGEALLAVVQSHEDRARDAESQAAPSGSVPGDDNASRDVRHRWEWYRVLGLALSLRNEEAVAAFAALEQDGFTLTEQDAHRMLGAIAEDACPHSRPMIQAMIDRHPATDMRGRAQQAALLDQAAQRGGNSLRCEPCWQEMTELRRVDMELMMSEMNCEDYY